MHRAGPLQGWIPHRLIAQQIEQQSVCQWCLGQREWVAVLGSVDSVPTLRAVAHCSRSFSCWGRSSFQALEAILLLHVALHHPATQSAACLTVLLCKPWSFHA